MVGNKDGNATSAVVSPLIANIYLHYAYDLWVHAWRRKVARGAVVVVRYADDMVVGFQYRENAERFQKELQERLAKFGLQLNAEKTRLIEFGRRAQRDRKRRGEGKPETFNFLGFTHCCGKHRKGYFALWRKTTRKRMAAKLKHIKQQLCQRRHEPILLVGKWLQQVVTATTTTMPCLGTWTVLHCFARGLAAFGVAHCGNAATSGS